MEEEERRRHRRAGRRFHDARNNFFRRGHGGHGTPCCRQDRRRVEEDTDAYTVYTPRSREESRERERRRQMRNRIREEERMEEEGRKKKKTAKSKIRRWSNCFCGILIVLGLIFVFYVITTLIIDGSTPLDYFLSEDEKNLPEPEPPDIRTKNNTDITRNGTKVDTSTIHTPEDDKKTVIHNSGNAETPGRTTPKPKDSVVEFGGNYENQFYPGNEEHNSSQNLTYIEGPEGRSYIAYIPVPLDNQEDEEEEYEYEDENEEDKRNKKNRGRKSQKDEPSNRKPVLVPVMIMPDNKQNMDKNRELNVNMPDVNRHGVLPDDYSRERELYNFRDNHRRTHENHNSGRRVPATFERGQYNNNRRNRFFPNSHKPKLIPARSPLLPILGRPRERVIQHNRPYIKSRNVPRNEYTKRRRNGWQRDAERGTSHLNRESVERYGDILSESSRFNTNSRTRSHVREPSYNNPLYVNRDLTKRQKYDLYRRYVANEKRRRRRPPRRNRNYRSKVPPEFQYPPTANSIQDIIRHMDGRDQDIPQHVSNHDNDDRDLREIVNTRYMPSNIYIGSQDHVLGHDVFEPNNGYKIGDQDHVSGDYDLRQTLSDIKIENNDDKFGRYPAYTNYNSDDYYSNTNINDYGDIYDNHNNQQSGSNYNNHPLPPVQNTYDVSSSNGRSKLNKPYRFMLDIYPVDDHHTSSSNQMQSVLRVGGNNNRRYQEGRDNTEDIVLHLNLFPKPQSRRSGNSQENKMGLSLEIPLNGRLSPLDIYRAIIAEARKGPIAYAQTDNERGNAEKSGDQVEIELFDIEEGPTLFGALEEGLQKLNRHIPEENKIQFSEFPVTKEDLLNAGNSVERELRPREAASSNPHPSWKMSNPFFDETVNSDHGRESDLESGSVQ